MEKTNAKFQKDCAHDVSTVYILRVKNDQVHICRKSDKNDLTIIMKPLHILIP